MDLAEALHAVMREPGLLVPETVLIQLEHVKLITHLAAQKKDVTVREEPDV